MALLVALMIFAFSMMIWLVGCDKPPEPQMEASKKSVEKARQGEAPKYAAQEFNRLQDSLEAALAEVNKQTARFALFRNYDQSRTTLAWVDSFSVVAVDKARENKEKMRKATEQMIQTASVVIDSTAALFTRAPRGKESREELDLLEKDLTSLRDNLEGARSGLQTENFPDAQSKAKAVQTRAEDIQRQLNAAIQRYEELKGKRRR